jgi:hypothetical protein
MYRTLIEGGTLHLRQPKTAFFERTILVGKDIIQGFRTLPNKKSKHSITLAPDAIARRFQCICAKAGIKYRFHDLHHYQASIMVAESVRTKYAMERIGMPRPTCCAMSTSTPCQICSTSFRPSSTTGSVIDFQMQ